MKNIYLTLVLFALAQPCLAADGISSDGKSHTLSINWGFGSVNTDISSEIDVDGDAIGGYVYGYKYDSTWTVNVGKLSGGSFCIITCFGDVRNLNYDSYILNIKGSMPLSNRWSFYGTLGANSYEVVFSGNSRIDRTDSGVGVLLATGFDFRAYNGFGLGFEAIYLDMGHTSGESFTLNFSYMF